jgi:hypothetical protein
MDELVILGHLDWKETAQLWNCLRFGRHRHTKWQRQLSSRSYLAVRSFYQAQELQIYSHEELVSSQAFVQSWEIAGLRYWNHCCQAQQARLVWYAVCWSMRRAPRRGIMSFAAGLGFLSR